MKPYPTFSDRTWEPQLKEKTAARNRRAKPKPPEIFVKIMVKSEYSGGYERDRFIPAKLRQKGNYVYLQWREGKAVRSFYLGKKSN